MSTESQQQIAREAATSAAHDVFVAMLEDEPIAQCEQVEAAIRFHILSAIERATEKDAIRLILEYEDGDCSNEAVTEQLDRILRGYYKTLREIKEDEADTNTAQPQRSEHQEWTADKVEMEFRYRSQRDFFEHVAAAHNSALAAAERAGFKRGITFYERNQATGAILVRYDEERK